MRGGGASSFAVNHSTITENFSAGIVTLASGGGIGLRGGVPLALNHSIVARNSATNNGAPDIYNPIGAPGPIQARHSFIGDNRGNSLIATLLDVPDADGNFIGDPEQGVLNPLLAPLADNGGPTLTHALLPDSPAINRGDLTGVAGQNGLPFDDQRGEPFGRVFGGRIDIGAFEYQAASDLNLLVDMLVDENDGDYSQGDLSLREAIALADLWSGADTIHFDPALAGGTILLTQGELKIIDSLTITGLGADLLTIDASGNDPTPDQHNGDGSRVFNLLDGSVTDPPSVIISDLTLTGGDVMGSGGAIISRALLEIAGVAIRDNTATLLGGGIYQSFQDLTIDRSAIERNSAGSSGGGVFNSAFASFIISDSFILDNHSNSDGGGIAQAVFLPVERATSTGAGSGQAEFPLSAVISIHGTRIAGNSAVRSGGGLSLQGGGLHSVEIVSSTISKNIALLNGGGILLNSSASIPRDGVPLPAKTDFALRDSVVEGNLASTHGGGLAVMGTAPIVELDRSTIRNNTANQNGGGLLIESEGTATIANSTINNNIAHANGGGIARFARGQIVSEVLTRNTTISGNLADGNGGGVYFRTYSNGSFTLAHSTATLNRANSDGINGGSGGGVFLVNGTAHLDHTIVAENVDRSLLGHDLTGLLGAAFAPRYSLIGVSLGSGLTPAPVGLPDANGNLIGGDSNVSRIPSGIGSLNYNGGPTLTHALLPSSAARDAGDPSATPGVGGVPMHDQRGAHRLSASSEGGSTSEPLSGWRQDSCQATTIATASSIRATTPSGATRWVPTCRRVWVPTATATGTSTRWTTASGNPISA